MPDGPEVVSWRGVRITGARWRLPLQELMGIMAYTVAAHIPTPNLAARRPEHPWNPSVSLPWRQLSPLSRTYPRPEKMGWDDLLGSFDQVLTQVAERDRQEADRSEEEREEKEAFLTAFKKSVDPKSDQPWNL